MPAQPSLVKPDAETVRSSRGPGWWPLANLTRLRAYPRLQPIAGAWLVSVLLSLLTSFANVHLGWNGIPLHLGPLTLDLTIYPPLVFSVLAAAWLGPGWGLIPIYLANLTSAIASGMSLPLAALFALAGVVETGMLWGSMVIFQIEPDLPRWRDLGLFLLASLAAVAASSLAAITWSAAHALPPREAQSIWRGWLVGDLFLIVVVVAPLLYLAGPRIRPWVQRHFPDRPRYEFSYASSVAALVASLAILGVLVFIGVLQLASSIQVEAREIASSSVLHQLSEIVFVLALLTVALVVATGLFGYALAHLGEQQRREAVHDGLTGLLNRRAFPDLFRLESERSRRLGKGIGLLFLDLDYFKEVNDRYGHDAGDRVLVSVSEVIRHTLRETDHVFRWGGEEFIALLPHTSSQELPGVAERVRGALAERLLPITEGGPAVRVTASIGATASDSLPADAEALITAADRACYEAKDRGRNSVQVVAGPGEAAA